MKIQQSIWTNDTGWADHIQGFDKSADADLVLVFGTTGLLKADRRLAEIRGKYPKAYICGCTTAGEIAANRVRDDSLSVAAVQFQGTMVRAAETSVAGPQDSFAAGQYLGSNIPHDGLVHAFVLSDGLAVNGSELARGITAALPAGTPVTGGLAGDGARFAETYVCAGGTVTPKRIVLLGFYGSCLRVGYGSMGGWDPFGPPRRITRSKDNILYELDGRSALSLYKQYLGPHAAGLPASGLLFPLALRDEGMRESVVRTILAVNEQDQSMTFAGDMPQGSLAQLMRATFDRLVSGADGAARACHQRLGQTQAQLAVLISCVGRKLVLKQRIEEEVDAAINILGSDTVTTGFYSYGEITPLMPEARCALHNQTMTITTFTEG